MPQIHHQQTGLFHVVTKAAEDTSWCTKENVPACLIQNIFLTRNIYSALVHAFCILPNHLHILMCPGQKGISSFMQSFKSNSAKDVRILLGEKISWQAGFYDRKIRTEAQRSSAFYYVQGNAAKHRFVKNPADWPWTSIHFSDVCDPIEIF